MNKFNLPVQWFPGHMTKARRMMEEQIRLVDVVVEMLDARIPEASTNPLLAQIIGQKPRVVAMNKVDLAEEAQTDLWLASFRQAGLAAVAVDCNTGKGVKQLLNLVQQAARPVLDKWLKKGVKNRSVRVMIVGIPNVGKSTLINRLVGKNKVVAQNRPGVTRGQQWVTIAKGLDLLDTPGVLWPKFEGETVGFALAVTGAIKEDVFDRTTAAEYLAEWLGSNAPALLTEGYGVQLEGEPAGADILETVARKRGWLRSGGLTDRERTEIMLLRDFRNGKLGRITLDRR